MQIHDFSYVFAVVSGRREKLIGAVYNLYTSLLRVGMYILYQWVLNDLIVSIKKFRIPHFTAILRMKLLHLKLSPMLLIV